MIILFVIKIVANDDNTTINAKLWGGHGSRELVRMLFFPSEGVFSHFGNNILDLVVDHAYFGGFLAK